MNKDRGKQIISATISLSLMGNAVRASDATEVVPAHGKFYLAPPPCQSMTVPNNPIDSLSKFIESKSDVLKLAKKGEENRAKVL